MNIADQIQADKKLIEELGGPATLAKILGYDKSRGGVQRVQNWTTRGIPSRVKVDHPKLFLTAPTAKPPKKPPLKRPAGPQS